MALFSLHLTFADGSNPYCRFNMDNLTYKAEMAGWRKNYTVIIEKREHRKDGSWMIFGRVSEKGA